MSAAQTGTDPLGAQSASPVQTQGTPDQGGVEGEFGKCPSSGSARASQTGCDQGDTEPASDKGDAPSGASLPSADAEAKASGAAGSQAAALPFTGFLAIPVLLAGLALLGTGLVVRSRTTA